MRRRSGKRATEARWKRLRRSLVKRGDSGRRKESMDIKWEAEERRREKRKCQVDVEGGLESKTRDY